VGRRAELERIYDKVSLRQSMILRSLLLTSGMRHPKYFLMSNRTFLYFYEKFVYLK
jgi:hypothetical protein